MKVIFLDFDGVLNTEKGHWIKACIEQLNRITDETGAFIVVSSSWRSTYGLAGLQELLKQIGVTGLVYDFTPLLTIKTPSGIHLQAERGIEILAYRRMHGIEKCVAIDDYPDGYMEDILVQTAWEDGLTPEKANEAIRNLNR